MSCLTWLQILSIDFFGIKFNSYINMLCKVTEIDRKYRLILLSASKTKNIGEKNQEESYKKSSCTSKIESKIFLPFKVAHPFYNAPLKKKSVYFSSPHLRLQTEFIKEFKRERRRETCHLLVHSPSGRNDQGRAKSFCGVSPGPAFTRPLADRWIRSGAAGTHARAHMACHHCKHWFCLFSYNAGPTECFLHLFISMATSIENLCKSGNRKEQSLKRQRQFTANTRKDRVVFPVFPFLSRQAWSKTRPG